VCGKQTKNLKLGQNSKVVMVAFEPIFMPAMSFLKNLKVLVLLYMFKNSKKN
jgi:hypothetical protein